MRSPESLDDDVIDRLFSALLVRYGLPFLDRWRDLDLSVVKGDWARELSGFSGKLGALRFALDHLPEKPPTVIEFRKLCNAASAFDVPRIGNDAPVSAPNAAERELLRSLAGTFRNPARANREWAYRLIERHENGDPRPMECVAMARRALGIRPPDIDETPLSDAEVLIAEHDAQWQPQDETVF